jgi:hypothetical protein
MKIVTKWRVEHGHTAYFQQHENQRRVRQYPEADRFAGKRIKLAPIDPRYSSSSRLLILAQAREAARSL